MKLTMKQKDMRDVIKILKVLSDNGYCADLILKNIKQKTGDINKIRMSELGTLSDVINKDYALSQVNNEDLKKEEKIQIITPKAMKSTWEGISETIKAEKAEELLCVGDKIPFQMKDGTEVVAVVAHVKNKGVYFVIEDAIARHPMYKTIPENEVISWSGSDMRRYLNKEAFENLPPALAAVIKKRTIQQNVAGNKYVTEDKLWLPSCTEVFGKTSDGKVHPADSEKEFHFDLFNDEKSRIKQYKGETTLWFLRTKNNPDSASSTLFRGVFSGGHAGGSNATNTHSVCFGFYIGR